MKKYYAYLGSVFLALVICNLANAQEELNVNTSGFITATAFSDNNWYPYKDEIALNFDVTYSEFALRGQVAAPFIHVIRRLVGEYSFPLVTNTDVTVQLGEFPRLTSIYSLADAPGNAAMAILPLGLYDRRTISNQTFTTIVGVNFDIRKKVDAGVLEFRADYGKLNVENQCETQEELTRASCINGVSVYGVDGNYDYGFTYRTGDWFWVLFRTSFAGGTNLNNTASLAAQKVFHYDANLQYVNDTIGVAYAPKEGFYFDTEFLHDVFYRADVGQSLRSGETAITGYAEAGYTFNDYICTYLLMNTGKTSDNYHMKDNAVGVTVSYNKFVTSLEFHHGSGILWANYNATLPNWNSFVLSTTYSF